MMQGWWVVGVGYLVCLLVWIGFIVVGVRRGGERE
jgi:hypothetical protein